jgi:hypothetical protein
MSPRDATAESVRMQAAIHAAMTTEERLRIAIDMSDFTRDLARAGLRARRPELSEAEIERELLRLLYPNEAP